MGCIGSKVDFALASDNLQRDLLHTEILYATRVQGHVELWMPASARHL
jgi:hypothetical protein